MTDLVVLGGTGYAGGHIAAEAARRGLSVRAVSRHVPEQPAAGVDYVTGDVLDDAFLGSVLEEAGTALLALSPRGGMEGQVLTTAERLIPMAIAHGVRLGVIGGAGGLKVSADGPRLVDTDSFPEEIRPESEEMAEIFARLQSAPEDLDWFFVNPAAGFGAHQPGQRTGTFRLGGDVLLTDEDGNSDISGADFAMAVVDEIQRADHRRGQFSVAY
ncbi:NAD(P)-dependent oxidoreductase [Bogoriella caseilytica]|uniref:NAD(P)-binding domain-containing protein n=1 Tax=Bogoriella caseilytica TaxID=56055 RepID=A0A3N2BDY9_9MICO|nr:NAD(P)H-binding protein [Bogoriella caseilytica]ROR73466.1 hypothetical protein EDD31_1847 [Bogoriella caseilytica]